MKSKKITAIVLSALMALSVNTVAATAAFAAEPAQSTTLSAEPNETVTVAWSNENYPVTKNDAGEYVAINKNGKPAKYNGLQIATVTTQNSDGTKTVETTRYTFKDGKCTDVKTSTKTATGTTQTTDAKKPAANKEVESTKVTYSNEKYQLSEDGKQVTTKDGRPVKYNGLLIRTTVTTFTDGSTSTTHDRFNFKDGVLQEAK